MIRLLTTLMIFGVSAVLVPAAWAQSIPSIRGTYAGSGTLTQSGCQNPVDNGSFPSSTSVTLNNQGGSSLTGSASLTAIPQAGRTLTAAAVLTGSVNSGGIFGGAFTYTSLTDGVPTSTGTGTFSGSVSQSVLNLNISFSGQASSGGSCSFMGSLTSAALTRPLAPDFDGDGRADVAIHDGQSGNWFVGRSTGMSFNIEPWVNTFGNRGPDVEDIFLADFTGDGRTDVAIHDKQTGDWYVGRSSGTSFSVELWIRGFGNRGSAVEDTQIGDFTGDGKADIVIHDRVTGTWYVGRSTGSSFGIETWVTEFGNRGPDLEDVFVADFTGDGKADVAIHDRQTGAWHIGRSTGSSFVIEPWAAQFGNRPTSEEILVADFTGDGKADVAIHDRQTGNWHIGRSTGSGFAIEQWITGFGNRGAANEDVFVADFTGDGKADAAIHDRQTGAWFIGRSTGSTFLIEQWAMSFGNLSTVEEVLVADFTGDGKADAAIHNRQTGDWFIGRSTGSTFIIEPWVSSFGNRGESIENVFGGNLMDHAQ